MKVAIREIYYKAVTPSCYIVDMSSAMWDEFLYAKADRRKELACQLTGTEECNIREVAWIPLEGQDLLKY